MTAYLRLANLSKRYGDTLAVNDVTLDVAPGEMVVLLGPSGCGKTTTLRMIAGFVDASDGDILLEGRSIRAVAAHRREMGIVFQSYALFPHLTVTRNVAFGLEMRRQSRGERDARVAEMLRLVKLERFADRLPRHLSGGQQQRVAIARALAIHPKMLLLDEPLSNLDAELRAEVGREIRLLQRDNGLTAIMVTHDQQEAMAMADRLVVMRDGRVQQVGSQEDLYERPLTPFVARFIGNSNLITGRLVEASEFVLDGGTQVDLANRYAARTTGTLAVRPERVTLAPPGADPQERTRGVVQLSTYMGATMEHVVALGGDLQVVVRGASSGLGATHRFPVGEMVALCWAAADERLFDETDRPAVTSDTTSTETQTSNRVASNA